MSNSGNTSNYTDHADESFETGSNGSGGPNAIDHQWQNGGQLVDLILGANNPEMVYIGMAMYEAAMEACFEEGWVSRGGHIQQHEDVAHAAGYALGQAEGEQMAKETVRMAREEAYADGFCKGYMAARKESMEEIKSEIDLSTATNFAPDVANTLGKIIAGATTSYQLSVEAVERFVKPE